MQRRIAVIAVTFFVLQIGHAEIRIGFHGGLNFATLSNSSFYSGNPDDLTTYLAPVIGGILDFQLSGPIFLRLEPSYVQKGAAVNATRYGRATTPFKLDLVQIPVLLVFDVPNMELRPYIFLGPNLGFLLTTGYNKADPGIDAGFGIAYDVSENATLLFDIRYSAGLADLDPDQTATIKTRGIQPLVGLVFVL